MFRGNIVRIISQEVAQKRLANPFLLLFHMKQFLPSRYGEFFLVVDQRENVFTLHQPILKFRQVEELNVMSPWIESTPIKPASLLFLKQIYDAFSYHPNIIATMVKPYYLAPYPILMTWTQVKETRQGQLLGWSYNSHRFLVFSDQKLLYFNPNHFPYSLNRVEEQEGWKQRLIVLKEWFRIRAEV